MPEIKAWDIVIVPFPFVDKDTKKRRPALVISSPDLPKNHGLYWLAMITSAKNKAWEGDIKIADLAMAGLPSPSIIRAAKITTVQEDVIVRACGILDKAQRGSVLKTLTAYLARP